MADGITVSERPDGALNVTVRQPNTTTRFVVTVPADLPGALGAPDIEGARLVQLSFVFLLEREPASSILRRFSLDVIGDYFPEYRAEMALRLT